MMTGTPDTVTLVPINRIEIHNSRDRNMKVFEEIVDNIRVLTIAPHAESPGLKGWFAANPEEAAAFFRTIPLGRIGRLEEDIGRAIVALCGPDMDYLTGATIPLDGGQANIG